MGPNQTHKPLPSKGNHKQNEEVTRELGENMCKHCEQHGPNVQNTQPAHTAPERKEPTQLKNGQKTQMYLSEKDTHWPTGWCRCSTSPTIREMHLKTTVRHLPTLARMATIKMSTNNKFWRRSGEKGISAHCGWECSWCSHLGKQHGLLAFDLPHTFHSV